MLPFPNQSNKVKSIMIASLQGTCKTCCTTDVVYNTVLSATRVNVDGKDSATDMVLSVSACGGFPHFRQMKQMLVLNEDKPCANQ